MWIGMVSLFPQMLSGITRYGVTQRAYRSGLFHLHTWNPRDFTTDVHRTVDERPYGGGPGMVLKVEPMQAAIRAAKRGAAQHGTPLAVGLCPRGVPITQDKLQHTVNSKRPIVFVAGRYEGIDERINELEIDEHWSLGDYIISGGELAAMVMIDALVRLLPGALGHAESTVQESFSEDLLDCPHYTRPAEFGGLEVPAVLMSGDHQAIAKWRFEQQQQLTQHRRPDLWQKYLKKQQTLATHQSRVTAQEEV